MNPIKTKFRHNQEVIISLGYYRGFKAKIQDFKNLNELDSDLPPKVEYRLKIDNLSLKEEYWIGEEFLFAYRKYILF